LVPLQEILAQALSKGVNTKAVEAEYTRLVDKLGSEFAILLDLPPSDLRRATAARVVHAIAQVRAGNLTIRPGYDGQYGEIRIPLDEDLRELSLFS
jgi:PHP family Zn ribbon phosphoesterase